MTVNGWLLLMALVLITLVGLSVGMYIMGDLFFSGWFAGIAIHVFISTLVTAILK